MLHLKRLLKISFAVCLLGLVGLIALVTLVDPNQYKQDIQNQIALKTGQNLTIQGPIFWQLDPSLAIEAYDLSCENSVSPGRQWMTLKKARLKPKLWSIIFGKLWTDFELEGLELTLSHGFSDWQAFQNHLPQLKTNLLSSFIIPYNLKIENASFAWQDLSTHQPMQIKQFNFTALKLPLAITGTLVPVNTQFQIENLETGVSHYISLAAEWLYQHEKNNIQFEKIILNAHLDHCPPTTLTGEFTLEKFTNEPQLIGKLQLINFNFQGWSQVFSLPPQVFMAKSADLTSSFNFQYPALEFSDFHLLLENNGSIEGSFKTNLQNAELKKISFSGHFQGKKLRIGVLPIPEFNTQIDIKDAVVSFDHIQTQLSNSQHHAKLKIDFRSSTPQFYLFDQISSLDINEVLGLLGQKDKIKGRVQIETSLTTQGTTLYECVQNLFGKAHLLLTDGKLQGIELSPLLQHAQSTVSMITDSLAKKQNLNIAAVLTAELGEWKQQAIDYQQLATPFELIEANITIENGRLYTSDFKLLHPEYSVNGHGILDLLQQKADYQALALFRRKMTHASQKNILTYLKDTPLAIQIRGPLRELAVQPDLARYADDAIRLIQKDPIEGPSDNGLEKLFGFP